MSRHSPSEIERIKRIAAKMPVGPFSKNPSGIIMLRNRFPDREWKAVRDGCGWRYVSEEWEAVWRSALAPKYDGDDSTTVSQLWLSKAPTGRPILIWSGNPQQT